MEAHPGKLFGEDAAAAAYVKGWCLTAVDAKYFVEEPLEVADAGWIHRRFE
jgi:hypothetical protein